MSIVRSSKFRHVFGTALKKDICYDNIRITKSPHDSNMSDVNGKFLAVVQESQGGGSFLVIPLEKTGRIDQNYPKFAGHKGNVSDLAFDPFNDNRIASCSEDCMVHIWDIPDGGITSNVEKPTIVLEGHQRKVLVLAWHPTASGIIASGSVNEVIVWNIAACGEVFKFENASASAIDCTSLFWNTNGSLLYGMFKDKTLKMFDPRKNELVQETTAHSGSKGQKGVCCGNYIFTTGHTRSSERQYALWRANDITKPLVMEDIDTASGVYTIHYDPGTKMVYLIGKGDVSIKFFEITDEAPYVHFLSMFQSKETQRSAASMPKRFLSFGDCEVMRFYRLLSSKGYIEPVIMKVPRKSSMFQDDIYPPCFAGIPALTAEEWLAGENKDPVKVAITKAGLGSTSGGGTSASVTLCSSSLSKQSSLSSTASTDPKPFEREHSPISLSASGDFDDSQYKKEIQDLKAQLDSVKSENQRLKSDLKAKESVIAGIKKLLN